MTKRQGLRDLDGRTVVVTGGARGIGAAIATRMHERGAKVAIADIDGEQAALTAAGLGDDAIGRSVDVTDRAAFAAFLDDVEATLGPLAVLVNNAGFMVVDSFLDEDPDRADLQIALNLTAVVHGAREGARRMKANGGGHIVNVASAAGRMGFVGVSTYCATKFGVHGLSEALRRELHGTGISVSCVMPGLVDTELISGLDKTRLLPTVTPDYVAVRVVRAVERGRFAVFTPRIMPLFVASNAIVPIGVMDRLMRLLGGDTLMLGGAHSPGRRAYDARTGEPGAVAPVDEDVTAQQPV
ncbi:SDR family NAD(P)-dependent oxidoreductase [Nocardioides sp. LML1-1-1.1]|uniref:SDR family NAD(P)-dependent oxidoreductase n=1 Tax=Nocardioides sp. LML1-1-1.1 TaxID=3135248 RepID=UPI003424D5C7